MIYTWTAELIDDSLTGLSEKQLAALDLAASMTAGIPGATRLGNFGFENTEQYDHALAAARTHTRMFFAIRGVRHVNDLAFAVKNVSVDGMRRESLQKKP